jgi:hypothetical protein
MPLLPSHNWEEFSTLNRSQQLAIAELVAHGGSAEDVRKLRECFEKTEDQPRDEAGIAGLDVV